MVGYRRNRVTGGTFFFTVVLQDRSKCYLVDHVDLLRQSFLSVRKTAYFKTVAAVILPDHLHMIWQLPENDDDYSGRWRAIKSLFSRSLVLSGLPLEKNNRGEYYLWQKRYWEHTIRNEQDLKNHVDYIHFNPAKHKYVNTVSEWPYSSFHKYVKKGWLAEDWGDDVRDFEVINFGE